MPFRVENGSKRGPLTEGVILATAVVLLTTSGTAQSVEEPAQTLFINVNIFEGSTDGLIKGKRVLVEDNLIKAIGDDTLKAESSAAVVVR
jgi:hypothetical protein